MDTLARKGTDGLGGEYSVKVGGDNVPTDMLSFGPLLLGLFQLA